jgi:hypothetical protein
MLYYWFFFQEEANPPVFIEFFKSNMHFLVILVYLIGCINRTNFHIKINVLNTSQSIDVHSKR